MNPPTTEYTVSQTNSYKSVSVEDLNNILNKYELEM